VTPDPWWQALPAVETWVPCGDGRHPVRWADGALSLPAHPDPEAEAVLAGQPPSAELFAAAAHAATAVLDPPADLHGSAEYRTKVAGALVRRV